MTRSENIISRWSRMKQESARHAEPDGSSSEPKPIDAEPGDLDGATVATPATNSPTSATFDPATLPPLQSITVGTDIRSFLASNVPVELANAALRRAWVTDPAIRDFIGIAESQWDFNDPTAMPGFGPLLATDNAQSLASQFSRVASASDAIAAEPDFPAQPAETLNEPRDRHADKVWRS